MSLPTEPGIYKDRFGLPWTLSLSHYMILNTDVTKIIDQGEALTWRFGDESYSSEGALEFGPFELLLTAEEWGTLGT